MILGLVIGILALIIIIVLILVFVLRKKKKDSNFEDGDVEMTIETNMQSDSEIQDFSNPLYNEKLPSHDPFEQQFNEDIV